MSKGKASITTWVFSCALVLVLGLAVLTVRTDRHALLGGIMFGTQSIVNGTSTSLVLEGDGRLQIVQHKQNEPEFPVPEVVAGGATTPPTMMQNINIDDEVTDALETFTPPTLRGNKQEDFMAKPLDPESCLGLDLGACKLETDTDGSRTIRIDIGSVTDCRKPEFVVRVSGTAALYVQMSQDPQGNFQEGRFLVPKPGPYYIEVFLLFCNIPEDDALNSTCVIPRDCGPLYELSFVATEMSKMWPPDAGAWLWLPETVQGGKSQGPPPRMKTRYQKPWQELLDDTPNTNLDRFRHYVWTQPAASFKPVIGHVPRAGSIDYMKSRTDILEQFKGENKTIALVGASFTRMLMMQLKSLLGPATPGVRQIECNFPLKCPLEAKGVRFFDTVVISLGQWPGGWPEGRPWLPKELAAEMETMLNTYLLALNNTITQQIWIRAMDVNPLGRDHLKCPPRDWRTPLLTRLYSAELRKVVAKFQANQDVYPTVGFGFIDNSDVTLPLWDAAADWCHPLNTAASAEAIRILELPFLD